MKIGDVIIDKQNNKWIIFDFWKDCCCVTDFTTQTINTIVPNNNVIGHQDCNAKWLFLKKRETRLKDVKEYLK